MRASETLAPEDQWDAISRELEGPLWRHWLRTAFHRATRAPATGDASTPAPTVSVIVCTRDRPADLRACLDSLVRLRTPPHEILVVDNCPSDDRAREVCAESPARYLREDRPGASRARNRGIVEATGEVIAFLDDDCVVDPGWLDELGETLADPLVMALTGYLGPLELDKRAQYLFEVHGGFQRYPERRVFDGARDSPVKLAGVAGASANSMFRRRVFEELGLFAEDLGPATPTRAAEDKYLFYRIVEAGYRIVFDPARIVWHRHRRDYGALRRTLFGYTVGEFAYTTRCLLRHREPGVLSVWAWWLRHLGGDLWLSRRGDERSVPLGLIAAEATGMLAGPWMLFRSARRGRRCSSAGDRTRASGEPSPGDPGRAPRPLGRNRLAKPP